MYSLHALCDMILTASFLSSILRSVAFTASACSLPTSRPRCHTSQHDPDDEPCAPPLDPEFFEFDRESSQPYIPTPHHLTILLLRTVHKDDISREQLKVLLYDEIMSFHPAPMS